MDREIGIKAFQERHRAAYYSLIALTTAVLGFIFILDGVLLASFLSSGTKVKIIKSGSMEPAIKTGSMVMIVPQDEYRPGDVIDFPDPEIGSNVHRIIGMAYKDGEQFFVTKGDNLDFPDNYLVPAAEVEGKVVLILPYLGYVAYIGFFAALIPVSLLLLHLIRRKRAVAGTD